MSPINTTISTIVDFDSGNCDNEEMTTSTLSFNRRDSEDDKLASLSSTSSYGCGDSENDSFNIQFLR